MDKLKISSKTFSDAGFDSSLVSRWRTGNRRIMPNRPIVKSVIKIFWNEDAKLPEPLIVEILHIRFPGQSCNTQEERDALLETLLTEKDQLSPDYQQWRNSLIGNEAYELDAKGGVAVAHYRLIDFFDLIIAQDKPMVVYFVFPYDIGAFMFDGSLAANLKDYLKKLYDMGCSVTILACSDIQANRAANLGGSGILYNINGYCDFSWFDTYGERSCCKLLAVADRQIALEISTETPFDLGSSKAEIYTEEEEIDKITQRINGYLDRQQHRLYHGFFRNPNGLLSNIHISPNNPSYAITLLPYFGILPPDKFSASFGLDTDDEIVLRRELYPFMLPPTFFSSRTTVRHIFCETAIDTALAKQRHESFELSVFFRRRIWMSTQQLVFQLAEIKALLLTCPHYEVSFLKEADFDIFQVQAILWGREAYIAWHDIKGSKSVLSTTYASVSTVNCYFAFMWQKIAEKKRSRDAAMRKINKWLKHAAAMGFEVES
ncbi:MAG: hypothetical protein LBS74_09215 [Oscillospiraceae bacterium]|nr:hypothetical protein [Oscillospiraceae bacterium]